MSKSRVYELARELQIESKAILARLKSLGITVASHQSTLTDVQVQEIRRALGKETGVDETKNQPKVIRRRRAGQASDEGEADGSSKASAEIFDASPDEMNSITAQVAKVRQSVGSGEEPSAHVSSDAAFDASSDNDAAESATHEASEVVADHHPGDEKESVADRTPPPVAPAPRETSGGATIVRRATQAEIEDSKASLQRNLESKKVRRPPLSSSGAQGAPRSDSSSGGFRPPANRPAPSAAGSGGVQKKWEFIEPAPEQGFRGVGKGLPKSKFRQTLEEPVEPKKPVVPLKGKREMNNLRSLLELASVDRDDDQPVDLGRKRTVYTPNAQSKKRDLKRRKDLKKTQITTPRAAYRIIGVGREITIAELAKQMSLKAADLIKTAMMQGAMVTVNQSIDFDMASILATEHGFEVVSNEVSVEDVIAKGRDSKLAMNLVERAPIVTIMGHVDHGKTSILDAIRKARVAEGESGGITQHIGAYSVLSKNDKRITFLDTPGHEAFSAMRQRGAKVTDIVILVVAADDGVKPQTVEAISHAKAANVPIIVAINKIDKPTINIDRVYRELMEHGIQSEDWGGETQFVKVSALQGTGLDDLLEAISLQAEVLELKANPTGEAAGVVVEAHLDANRGPVATVIVQEGSVKISDIIVAGATYGRVRVMHTDDGRKLEEAGPSIPVQIIGLEALPMAGDQVNTVKSEKIAKEITSMRRDRIRAETSGRSGAATLESLLGQVSSGERPVVPLVVKGDTQGSIEAMSDALKKLNTAEVENKIIHQAVGGITESDVRLAATSGAVIIGFNSRLGRGLSELADRSGVPVKYFSIIYDVVDAVKAMMAGKLPPILTEVIQGHAEVRQTIKVPKFGMVAGTAVLDGKILRNSMLRLIRDDVVIFEGKVNSLRRFKDDVKEVATGYECGIGIEGCTDIREGDVIESFLIEEAAATL